MLMHLRKRQLARLSTWEGRAQCSCKSDGSGMGGSLGREDSETGLECRVEAGR